MFNEDHDLIHELPEYKEQIHELKLSNKHFAALYDEYHELDKELLRIEKEVEHAGDVYVEGLKKKRLKLKDELFQMLKKAA